MATVYTRLDEVDALMEEIDDSADINPFKLATDLRERVKGQDHVVADVANAIAIAEAQTERVTPPAILLFVGPSGTGKSFLAKEIARHLNIPVEVIEGGTLKDKSDMWTVFGARKGHVGSDSPGQIIRVLRQSPRCLIIWDEAEKMFKEAFDMLLTATQEGYFTDPATGRRVNCNQAYQVFTSNLAWEDFLAVEERFANDPFAKRAAQDRILIDAGYKPEFVNRVTGVYCFKKAKPTTTRDILIQGIVDYVYTFNKMEIVPDESGIDPRFIMSLVEAHRSSGMEPARFVTRALPNLIGMSCVNARKQWKVVRIVSTPMGWDLQGVTKRSAERNAG